MQESRDTTISALMYRSVSRRSFLKYFIRGGVSTAIAIGANGLDNNMHPEQESHKLKSQSAEKCDDVISGNKDHKVETECSIQPTLSDTFVDSVKFSGLQIAGGFVTSLLKLPVGNAGLSRLAERSNISPLTSRISRRDLLTGGTVALLQLNLFGPIKEEYEYRFVPSLLTNLITGDRDRSITKRDWISGAISTTMFAAAHNKVTDPYTGQEYYDTSKIPLFQTTLGGFTWKLMRERGLSHSILAHVVNNTTACTLGLGRWMISEAFSKLKKQ